MKEGFPVPGLFISFDNNLWHRVVAMGTPWVAPGKPVHGQFESLQTSMLLYRLNHILGTGGNMPAGSRREWRNDIPVDIYKSQQPIFGDPSHGFQCRICGDLPQHLPP